MNIKTLLIATFILIMGFTLKSQIVNVPEDYSSIQTGTDAANSDVKVLVSNVTCPENMNLRYKAISVASHFIMDEDTTFITKIIDGSQPVYSNFTATVGK